MKTLTAKPKKYNFMNVRLITKLLIGGLLLSAQLACTATSLPPYEASYTTRLRGIKINGTRSFKHIADNRYQVSWQAKALWMRLNEWSEVEIINDEVRPLSYHYTRKGLGTDRPVHIYFNWETMQANGSKGDDKYQFAITDSTQDRLSYQVQMQLDLLRDANTQAFDFDVAAHNRIKNYRFEHRANEIIDTTLGERESMLFERSKSDQTIRVWLAPQHYYLPIQFERIDDDGDNNMLTIKSWQSDEPTFRQAQALANTKKAQIVAASNNIDISLDDDKDTELLPVSNDLSTDPVASDDSF